MNKFYVEKETKRARRASRLYRLLEVLEYMEEDLLCDNPHIGKLDEDEKELSIYVYRCDGDERSIVNRIREIEDLADFKVNIARSIGYGMGIEDLYRAIGDLVERDTLDLLKPLAIETAKKGGIEYIAVLLRSGLWILLEGEKHRVRMPWIEESIAIAHTHPPGGCIPSRPDLESCLELLSNGGILCGVLSVECSFMLRLMSPLSIECYEHFTRIINRYYDLLGTVKDARDFIVLFRDQCKSVNITISPL
ncbi:MAG: hypothetical protein RQ885_00990 [Desulfurococcales archaeon]|jgi:hypothetical protein|nr:hypothetical protein [Desulfurococcales archaeon]